jgi:cell division protein FtsB
LKNVQIGRFVRRVVRSVVPPTIFLGIAVYFGWNATQGDHGMQAYQQQLGLLAQAQQVQQDALTEQAAWRRRVNGLKEQSLDTDILDERARAMMNMADRNDIVIPYDRHDPLF